MSEESQTTKQADAGPARTDRGRGRSEVVVALLVGMGAALLALNRIPPDLRDVVWGEDGRNFLSDSLRAGSWQSLFTVYEGYLHVVPRLLTNFAVWAFPLDDFAIASSVLSSMVFGVVAALVFVLSRDVLPRRIFGVLLASVTVLAPTLSIEVLGNFANIHWAFLWLAPWLFLYRPRSTLGALGLGAVGLLCGLTEIQMLLFAPLALVNYVHRRAWLVSIPTIAGIAVQLVVTVLSPRTPNANSHPGILDIVVGYGELPVLASFEGHASRIGDSLASGGWVGAGLTSLAIVAILVFALWPVVESRGRARIFPIVLVAGSFGAWAAAVWLNPHPLWQYADYDTDSLRNILATRYVVVPSMLLLGALVFAASRAFEKPRYGGLVAGLVVGFILCGFLGSYHLDHFSREDGPSWSSLVADARVSCLSEHGPIQVRSIPSYWVVVVPCGALAPSR